MKILIIIPCYNEEENLPEVLENIRKNKKDIDVLIVDDCSGDNTKNLCAENRYAYLTLPFNLGVGGGVQTGYLYAKENNYDIAVQMDGDGQHDAVFLEELISPIESNEADCVIGSRFLEKSGYQSSFCRRMGIRLLEFLIWICYGKTIKDATSGYRAVNRKYINLFSQEYAQDYPEPEALALLLRHKGRVKEVPVEMHERMHGKSSISSLKSLYYMVKVSLAIIIQRIL